MALHRLHTEINCDELLFWGKINGKFPPDRDNTFIVTYTQFLLIGLKNDYFIAMANSFEGKFEFPEKRFYWCLSNDYTFTEMGDLNDQHKQDIDLDNSFFVGEPNRKLKKDPEDGEEAAAVEDNDEDADADGKSLNSDVSEEQEIKVAVRELIELDRLFYVVLAIENDCQIVPVGAYKMTSQHQVRRNEAFKGLSAAESLDVNKYLHFRNVQDAAKKKALDDPSAPFNPQFLESIAADLPRGCWNFQQFAKSTLVLGRSLLWPGFHFYHNHNASQFGSVYIGDGLKNTELQFMIQ